MAPTDELPDTWLLLQRYAAGHATPDEIDKLSSQLGRHPDQHAGTFVLGQLMNDSAARTNAPESRAALARLRARINGATALGEPRRSRVMARGVRLNGWTPRRVAITGAAGAALAALAIGFVARETYNRTINPPTSTYQTAVAQTAVISLADGTRMTLAPATTAVVSSNTVSLTGEAHFSVRQNTRRAFAVRTRNAAVEVLGTAFVVRQYPEEAVSRVVVEDGKVSLRAANTMNDAARAHVLTAHMLGRVTDSSTDITSGVTVQNYTGWLAGKVVLNDTPLGSALIELERAYGIRVRVADSALFDRKVTLSASLHTQSAGEVLEFVARTINAHTMRNKDGFVIVPGRVSRSVPRLPSLPAQKSPEAQYGK